MWAAGFGAGIGVGFVIGLVVGRLGATQKSWSELTEREKKVRLWAVGAGVALLAAGILAFALLR